MRDVELPAAASQVVRVRRGSEPSCGRRGRPQDAVQRLRREAGARECKAQGRRKAASGRRRRRRPRRRRRKRRPGSGEGCAAAQAELWLADERQRCPACTRGLVVGTATSPAQGTDPHLAGIEQPAVHVVAQRCHRNTGNQDRESAGVRRRQPRRQRGQLSLRRRGTGRRRRRGSACTAAPARHSTPRCAPVLAACVWGEGAAETAGFLCCLVAVRLGFACLLTDREEPCRGKEMICALVTWQWQLGQVSCHVQVLLRYL